MSYAIISVGGKQYRVREGEWLLVDRLPLDDGASFTPAVLLAGGSGDPQIAPADVVVTATVLSQEKGPKIRIGKYKKRTRRGSRGGRNRKKKATTAANGDGAEATELGEPDAAETVAVPLETNGDGAPAEPAGTMSAAEADDASTDSPDEAGYVPMSEWIEDFDRRA